MDEHKGPPNVHPEIELLGKFLSEFNKESDRGAALAAAAFLDETLLEILTNYLADVPARKVLLKGANAPLGTFSSRISAAYALGLLEEHEYREINIIRQIRNKFAHGWEEAHFTDGDITSLCGQLPWLGPEELQPSSTMRARFNFGVVVLLTDLMWRSRLVRQEQRSVRKWPNKSRVR